MLIILLVLFSCRLDTNKKHEFKGKVESQKTDSLLVYNKIINLMIKDYYYDRYLGKEGEVLSIKLFKKEIDSLMYNHEKHKLEEKISSNDILKGILYVNDSKVKRKKIDIEKINLPDNYINDLNKINKSVNTPFNIEIKNLSSNVMKIKPLSSLKQDVGFVIGKISFSELYINKKENYGFVYIEFVCDDSHCGQADIVVFKKVDKIYIVDQIFPLWEI
jgi:hypothetical protein